MSSLGRTSPTSMVSPSPLPTNGGSPSPGLVSPSFSIGSSGGASGNFMASSSNGTNQGSLHPNHPLSGSKHLCSICGDRASGKHYGVYSCEGCKGFFKRTVRKELVYNCREHKHCIIDKRQRNRCQYCRYRKCLAMGMKKEAVQEERQRIKNEKGESPEQNPINGAPTDMPISQIKEAEIISDPDSFAHIDQKPDISKCNSLPTSQMEQIVSWAKHIPHFSSLPLEDQMMLLKNGWNELLIASFSHRSIYADGAILLSHEVKVDRSTMQHYGLEGIFDRVLSELVTKMRELKMDKTELSCLKSIVLFNPDAKSLQSTHEVEMLRDKVYVALEEYTKTTYPDEAGRFPKLLLRMPALRSIGLMCTEHLFFLKDWQSSPKLLDAPIDKYLLDLLDDESKSGGPMSLS